MTERTAEETSRETIQNYRDTIGRVVGFVRSQEVTRAYTRLSL